MSEAPGCDSHRDLIPASANLESGLGVSRRSFSELGVEGEDALSRPLAEALPCSLLICFGTN